MAAPAQSARPQEQPDKHDRPEQPACSSPQPEREQADVLEATEMLLGLLTVMGTEDEDYETVEPNPERDHATAAAIGTAVTMFIAEQAASDDLRTDALELGGDYFDTAASSWYGRDETASWVAGYLLGFAE